MRVFIGIGLPIQVGERLARAANRLLPPGTGDGARIRWTQPSNMHVTLSFLGQVERARLEQIQESLATLRAVRLRLELSGIGVFAGIMHAKVKPSAPLLAFAEQVFESMERCGFAREQRPYLPHVTLARAKGRMPPQPFGKDDPAFWQAFEASEFLLYQSFTRPEGAYYEVLKAFPLG
jgi:RNA 2',3'-cyclic 3'-phosphodiesterase